MANIYFGIAVLTAVLLLSFLAFRQNGARQTRKALLLIILIGAILQVYMVTDFQLYDWDERYHALVAKNLMSDPLAPKLYQNPVLPYDHTDWTSNHVWLHKQPLTLWSMALSMSVFGVHEIAVRLPSALLTCLGIGLVFGIGRRIYDARVGLLAAYFLAINGLILELIGGRTPTDHIDIHYLFFVTLGVYLAMRFARSGRLVYNLLAGLAIGMAVLTKWLPALIVLPVWLLVVWQGKQLDKKQMLLHFALLCAVALAVFLPWQLYIHTAFPLEAQWESAYNFRHFTEVIEGHSNTYGYYFKKLRVNYGELIYLPLIWFIWRLSRRPFNAHHWALFVWVAVPLLFFTLAQTKLKAYLLFTSPALFIVTAAFWWHLKDWATTRKLKWPYQLLLVLMVALPLRYCIERIKPFAQHDRTPAWVSEIKAIGEHGDTHTLLFNYDNAVAAMFYTELTVYPILPDYEKLKELKASGFHILIYDDGKLNRQGYEGFEIVGGD